MVYSRIRRFKGVVFGLNGTYEISESSSWLVVSNLDNASWFPLWVGINAYKSLVKKIGATSTPQVSPPKNQGFFDEFLIAGGCSFRNPWFSSGQIPSLPSN